MLHSFQGRSVKHESVDGNGAGIPVDRAMYLNSENHMAGAAIAGISSSLASFASSTGSPVQMKMPGLSEDSQSRRTVSREGSLPLRHPTPDLQSLQGAYVGNVERLEQSAERLSLSSDIGEELRKMKLEQRKSESRSSSRRTTLSGQGAVTSASRQFSPNSHISSSVLGLNSVARSGGFSLSGLAPSPGGSIRSPSWTFYSPLQHHTSFDEKLDQASECEAEHRRSKSPTMGGGARNTLRITNSDILESPIKFEESKETSEPPERPATAVSTESYQQRMQLFADFDGVHISAHQSNLQPYGDSNSIRGRQSLSSLREPPFASQSHGPSEPSATKGMVFYPAPVPMMLNLPPKLSKAPPKTGREQRRTHIFGVIPSTGVHRSASELPEVLEVHDEGYGSKSADGERRLSRINLPPQLRADLFFEHKPIHQNVEMKGDSAVATLDSILDASAHAPINAFIDHPIAGRIGAEIYGKSPDKRKPGALLGAVSDQRKSQSSLNILKHRKSGTDILEDQQHSPSLDARCVSQNRDWSAEWIEDHVPTSEQLAENLGSFEPGTSTLEHGGSENNNELNEIPSLNEHGGTEEAWTDDNLFTEAPTTLLAELQIRKQQQQQRGRTAATAFPNGMQSTLLELDAVAQVQRESRKQKQVTLAWEDPDPRRSDAEKDDDDDVPLGLLYPCPKPLTNAPYSRSDESQPLGLIAKRSMEDNEPLSQRRARLTGKTTVTRNSSPGKRVSILQIPGLPEFSLKENFEEGQETLAQRLKRLKDPETNSQSRPLSGDFLNEVMSSFGGLIEQSKPQNSVVSQIPNPEETLGQRRKRLQAERAAKSQFDSDKGTDGSRPALQKRHTMADVPQARRPAALRGASSELIASKPTPLEHDSRLQQHNPDVQSRRGSSSNLRMSMIPSQNAMPYSNSMVFRNSAINLNTYRDTTGSGLPNSASLDQREADIDSKQRALIDRWRQSVM